MSLLPFDGKGKPTKAGYIYLCAMAVILIFLISRPFSPSQPSNVTVTFNSHGGSTVPQRTIRAGTALGALPTSPTRSGYTFAGWFTAATGDTQVNANNIVNSNVTYHARWIADSATPQASVSTIPARRVSLGTGDRTIIVGNSITLSATVSPIDATNRAVAWSSNNTSVATVNSAGRVTAVSAGTAIITATTVDGGFTATRRVNVLP